MGEGGYLAGKGTEWPAVRQSDEVTAADAAVAAADGLVIAAPGDAALGDAAAAAAAGSATGCC